MKKIIVGLLFFAVLFAGCQMPNNGSGDNKGTTTTDSEEVNTTEKAKGYYKQLCGSVWQYPFLKTSTYTYGDEPAYGFPGIIKFCENSIIFDNVEYSLNKDTDLNYVEKFNTLTFNVDNKNYFIQYIDEVFPLLIDYDNINDEYFKPQEYNVIQNNTSQFLLREGVVTEETVFIGIDNYRSYENYVLIKLASDNGNNSNFQILNGTYSFNNATGTQANGSITLSDGNWTYSGSKTNAPSGGTYTVSGSDITFSWTANGYSVSTTVTVSKSGSSVTLSSNEVVFFSTFFNSTAQSDGKYSLTFSYSE